MLWHLLRVSVTPMNASAHTHTHNGTCAGPEKEGLGHGVPKYKKGASLPPRLSTAAGELACATAKRVLID